MQAQLLLPLAFFGIRAMGVSRWQKVLVKVANCRKTQSRLSAQDEDDSQNTSVIARIVTVAANHGLFYASCLQQSLVLRCLLERNGIKSEIRFGARKENHQFQLHAWVEVNGQIISYDEGVHQSFSSLGVIASSRIDLNNLTEFSRPKTI